MSIKTIPLWKCVLFGPVFEGGRACVCVFVCVNRFDFTTTAASGQLKYTLHYKILRWIIPFQFASHYRSCSSMGPELWSQMLTLLLFNCSNITFLHVGIATVAGLHEISRKPWLLLWVVFIQRCLTAGDMPIVDQWRIHIIYTGIMFVNVYKLNISKLAVNTCCRICYSSAKLVA